MKKDGKGFGSRAIWGVAILLAVAAQAVSVRATTYYVRSDGNDSNNGTSPTTAFATFDKALPYVMNTAGNTIDVGEGEFECNLKTTTFKDNSTLQGCGPGKTRITFTLSVNKETMLQAGKATTIKGFTFTSLANHSTYVVNATGGSNITLEDLVVENADAVGSSAGVVKVESESSCVSRVVIRNCRGNTITGGMYYRGKNNSVIKNCLFYDNTLKTDSSASAANFYWFDGSAGRVYNCTFGRAGLAQAQSCWLYGYSGIVLHNCLVYSRNKSAAVEDHCCSNWTAADWASKCKDYANGDYTLTKTATDAIDKGQTIADVTDDLAGVARPQGDAYDIGCYEYVFPRAKKGLVFLFGKDFENEQATKHKGGNCKTSALTACPSA